MQELQHTQNFIRDPKTIKSLLKKTDINSSDTVLDIGAGDGLITAELSKIAKSVISIELDPQSIQNLQIIFANNANVQILAQDFFQYSLPIQKYKVLSNPPFNRISDIVRRFLDSVNSPVSMYLFMQEEAAERFIGEPEGKMTQVSAIYHPQFAISILSGVHRSEFVPIPGVDVVFTEFKKRKSSLIPKQQISLYRDFVSYTFNQWQPTVLDSLKKVFTFEQRKRINKDLKLEKIKPSELTYKQLYKLFNVFMKYVPIQSKQIVNGSYIKIKESGDKLEKQHRTRF